MSAAMLLTITALFAGMAVFYGLVRRRRRSAAKPPAGPPVSPPPQPQPAASHQTVLLTAQRVSAAPYDFLRFFRLEYPEEPDRMNAQQRHWAQSVIALLQQQDTANLSQVTEYAQKLKQEYPQFYFGYYAQALVLQRRGEFQAACRELEEGFPRSLQKYTLYAALGSLLYDHGEMNPALGWWIRSVVAQSSIRAAGLSVPFVLLGYAARFRNLTQIAETLFAIARQADANPSLLNEAAEEKLRNRLRDQCSDTVHQALVLLYTEYLPALTGRGTAGS